MRYNYSMNQLSRILVALVALLLVATGSALAAGAGKSDQHRSPVAASHQPEQPGADDADDADEQSEVEADEDGGAPSEKLLSRLADSLGTDADTIADLAAGYGVGGAVRILSWSDASGIDAGDIAAMFDGGMGWGEIASELDPDGELGLSPGIGSIMGHGAAAGAAHGRDSAPGQLKKQQ
jgi:hypothetical protein